jgi:hypothetical protein
MPASILLGLSRRQYRAEARILTPVAPDVPVELQSFEIH